MRHKIIICLLLGLGACNKAQDTSREAFDAVGEETSASWNKMRDLLDLGTAKKEKKVRIPPRYCYKTYEDVICYSKPLPGEEYRLTGYQEASGRTGYILEDANQLNLPSQKTKTVVVVPKADANKTVVVTTTVVPKSKEEVVVVTPPAATVVGPAPAAPVPAGPPTPAQAAAAKKTPAKTNTLSNTDIKKPSDQKQLKEVIFDPAELEPKQLVPDKPQ